MGVSLRKNKMRSLLVGMIFLLCFLIISIRLLWIQTVNSDEYLAEALETWIRKDRLTPKRGSVFDRTGTQRLAWEEDAWTFVANPDEVDDPKKTAAELSKVLGIDAKILEQILSRKVRKGEELRHGGKYRYPESVVRKVLELQEQKKIKGIYPKPTTARRYLSERAAHLIGFLNVDYQAMSGVEKYYDQVLRGNEGYIQYPKARTGMMLTDNPQEYKPPVHGKDLVLTLDMQIQQQVELELEEAIKNYNAKGGTAIVADPKTGEILAMASRPVFDPQNVAETINEKNARNLAVESQFEPGSTFKIVTLAAAVEEGLFDPDAKFMSGSVKVGDQMIRDWNGVGWGEISYREGVKLSSNVAFVMLGQKLGEKRLIRYIERFGFGDITRKLGERTGIDLPAEATGVYYGRRLYPSELAATAFGQGISVTPIQQVAAISAIANGGIWIQPHVMKEVREPGKTQVVSRFSPQKKRIISEGTARTVRELMRDVVKSGTGVEADIAGYRVAGKTGTAQKPDPEGRGYLKDSYVVSFIGFAPYDDPDVVVYVAIDEPVSPYGNVSGGTVAAPVAKEILGRTLKIRQYQQQRDFSTLK
ncbi:peptidoglycan D,D-transpeptidase FtsI family protein [Staphylospora marina]|uniref:peptidoglycan D,D-transpeptidase FtsI family protein n=1 Tax=Staphylospora marina TaxID=2490858 RepID=UPI000F5BB91A|nr:penicillin-binding transpeptidase domain-containing protein [Staphylospora marina]